MSLLYSVRDWSRHFENNRTRALVELRFVILPNKQDGDGYTELLDHENGAAHYGAWCAIVQVASKGKHPADACESPDGCSECRGVLIRHGDKPHDPASLSRLTRIPPQVFDEVLPRLVTIGWLEVRDLEAIDSVRPNEIPHPPAGLPSQSGTPLPESAPPIEQNRIEVNRTEVNSHTHRSLPPPVENVCVKSKFSLEQIRAYAWADYRETMKLLGQGHTNAAGIRNPEGWAIVAHRSGEFDDVIGEWLEDQPKAAVG